MLSMLQKIILLEMACLDMEAKLSTSCRMVKAMSFLSYQWAMSNFYLHQVFCQDGGELAWYGWGIAASGNSDWRIRWKEDASEAWPSCDYRFWWLLESWVIDPECATCPGTWHRLRRRYQVFEDAIISSLCGCHLLNVWVSLGQLWQTTHWSRFTGSLESWPAGLRNSWLCQSALNSSAK